MLFALSTGSGIVHVKMTARGEKMSKIREKISGGKGLKSSAKGLQSPNEKGRWRPCVVLSLVLTYQAAGQEDILRKYLQCDV